MTSIATAAGVRDKASVGLSKLVLLNEKGEEAPSRIGLFIGWNRDGLVGYCNVFHYAKDALTAQHCVEKLSASGAELFSITFFHNRTDEKISFYVDTEGQKFSWEKKFEPDLLAFPIPEKMRPYWDAIPRGEIKTDPTKVEILAYQLNDEGHFQMKRVECEGVRAKQPGFTVTFEPHTKTYQFAISRNGAALDEKYGFFMADCVLVAGDSGAVVIDDKGEAVALYHSTITREIGDRTYEQEIWPRFLTDFPDAKKEGVKTRFTPYSVAVPLSFIK